MRSTAVCDEVIDVRGDVFAACVGSLCAEVVALSDLVSSLAAGSVRVALGSLAALREELARVEVAAVAHFERLRAFAADGARSTSAWLEEHTGRSGWAARQVARAVEACAVPLVRQALVSGALSVEQASLLVPVCVRVRAGTCDEIELLVLLDRARTASHRELKLAVAELLTRLDAAAGHDASSHRALTAHDTDHGTAVWRLELEPAAHRVFGNAVDALVDEVWRAGRPVDAARPQGVELARLRADAAVELARRSLHGAGGPSGSVVRGRGTPEVLVLIDHQTLLGELTDAGLAELDDGTPISGATARRIACEAGILPVVLGGDSEVLDLGRRRRLASVAQRRALLVRWPGCAFPGCTVPIGWTKAHHLAPWSRDGTTDHELLVPLCERHHHLVHEGRWQLRRRDGSLDVHRPDGSFFARAAPGRRRAGPGVRPANPRPP
jgi:hypothetical protein